MTSEHHSPAPKHLSPEAKRWWASVVETFDLEPHHLKLLQAACESWDTMQRARATVAEHGQTYLDASGSPKAHPAVGIEKDAKIIFSRILRELDLDLVASPGAPRPPSLRSNTRRANAN